MSAMSDSLENRLIDFLFRGQSFPPPSALFLALFTSAPTDAGGGVEVTGGSYARVSIPGALASWSGTQGAGTTQPSSGTSGQISNNNLITFPAPSATWGVLTHWALFDAATGGTQLAQGALTTPKTVNAGDAAPSFAQGAFVIVAA
jgi:hypothetical protein